VNELTPGGPRADAFAPYYPTPADPTPADPTGDDPTADDLPADDLTADLASVGLTRADLTPELLAALDDTRRLVAGSSGPDALPDPPPHLVRRWDAALAALPPLVRPAPASATAPELTAPELTAPPELTTAPEGEPADRLAPVAPIRRRAGITAAHWGAGLMAVAAAAAVLALPGVQASVNAPSATAPTARSAAAPPTTGRSAASAATPADRPDGMALLGKDLPVGGRDYGPLADPGRRAGCLDHVGAAGASVLGARQVSLSGRAGVLLVLATDTPGQMRLLVVSPDCGPGQGEVLSDRPAGR